MRPTSPKQPLQLFHRLIIVSAFTTHIANHSRQTVNDQQVVAKPLCVNHSPPLKTTGMTLEADAHRHNCMLSSHHFAVLVLTLSLI